MARENTSIRNFESNDTAQSVPFSWGEKVQFHLSKKIHRKFHSNGKRSGLPFRSFRCSRKFTPGTLSSAEAASQPPRVSTQRDCRRPLRRREPLERPEKSISQSLRSVWSEVNNILYKPRTLGGALWTRNGPTDSGFL